VVTAVLPGSPAAASRISPGDRIVLLNGKIPTLQSCAQGQWASQNDPKAAVLNVVRGSFRRQVTVRLVPVGQILAGGWLSRNGAVTLTALNPDGEKEYGGFDHSYLLGIKWRGRGSDLEVSDVLVGSPAQQMGIAIGDRIVAINGVPVDEDPQVQAALLPSDRKVTVQLTMLSGGSRKNVGLTSMGISAIFHKMATEPRNLNTTQQVAETF
jgi:S1-C subfamily serine protease